MLTLANCDTVQAARSRDGESHRPGPERTITHHDLWGLRGSFKRVGCRFQWNDDGAWLLLPIDEEHEWVQLEVIVINGMPYLPCSVFLDLDRI